MSNFEFVLAKTAKCFMLSESSPCKMLQNEIHKTSIFHVKGKKKRGKRSETAFVKHPYILRAIQWGRLVWDPSPKGYTGSVEERRKMPRWYEPLWVFGHYLNLQFQAIRIADTFCDTSHLIKHFIFFVSKISTRNLQPECNIRHDSSFVSTALTLSLSGRAEPIFC